MLDLRVEFIDVLLHVGGVAGPGSCHALVEQREAVREHHNHDDDANGEKDGPHEESGQNHVKAVVCVFEQLDVLLDQLA